MTYKAMRVACMLLGGVLATVAIAAEPGPPRPAVPEGLGLGDAPMEMAIRP